MNDHCRSRASRCVAALVLLALLTTSSCRTARRSEPLQEPFVPANETIAAGQKAFMIHCHQCHPGGAAGLGPAVNDKPLPGAMIRLQVRQGMGAMPSFDEQHIPDGELDALVSYLHALREHGR